MLQRDIRSRLHGRVMDRLREVQSITKKEFGVDISIPEVKYRIRSTDAARMNSIIQVMDLNPKYLAHYPDEYIEHTVPHEYAHHAVHQIFGQVQFKHGQRWQHMMRTYKLPPKITHTYDQSIIVPTHTWTCGCAEHTVSKKLHLDMLSKKKEFTCSACGRDIDRVLN